MLDRRTFLAGSGAVLLAGSLTAQAQQAAKVYRIGVLSGSSAASSKSGMEQFREGLRQLGYVEGQNIIIEYRWAEGQLNRLPQFATDLTRIAPDLIIAVASQAAVAAHEATTSIPIVMILVGDPVYLGLAASLARPGKNLTGLTSFGPELVAKQLSLLTEAVPNVKRIAILLNPGNRLNPPWLKDLEAAARTLAVQLQVLNIAGPDDVATAFRDLVKGRAGAILVATDQVVSLQAAQINALALSNRLPTISGSQALMDAGGLMTYWIDVLALFRRAPSYVDKILKGAKPGDLPIEEPTKFEFIINLKTAKALGLTIPQALLVRADKVIE
jgi:putative ABC transport system substrate-binding protein